MHKGPRAAAPLVHPGRLDLDHLGPQVGQDHRAIGPGEGPGEIKNAQSVEWSGHSLACLPAV